MRDDTIRSAVDHLRQGLDSIFKGETAAFEDPELVRALPSTVDHMYNKGKPKISGNIIQWLSNGLLTEPPEIRSEIARALSKIGERLLETDRLDVMNTFSGRLLSWIRIETSVTSSMRKICGQLGELAQRRITQSEFKECENILEDFNLIESGLVRKDGAIRELVSDSLDSIVTEEIVDALLDEYHENKHGKRDDALTCMTHLAAPLGERLLNRLLNSEDMSERILILRTISDIGDPFIPPLTEHLMRGGPWYYIRNLVLLFGKVGNEAHLQILKPFLAHEDIRVQRETLSTILNIGGKYRERIFLSMLESCDERLKPNLIRALGSIGSVRALRPMISLLESSASENSESDAYVIESICKALSEIGSPEAMPTLVEVIKQKRPHRFSEDVWDSIRSSAADALMKSS